eukprot:4097610-Prymnesium_polylepis.2
MPRSLASLRHHNLDLSARRRGALWEQVPGGDEDGQHVDHYDRGLHRSDAAVVKPRDARGDEREDGLRLAGLRDQIVLKAVKRLVMRVEAERHKLDEQAVRLLRAWLLKEDSHADEEDLARRRRRALERRLGAQWVISAAVQVDRAYAVASDKGAEVRRHTHRIS